MTSKSTVPFFLLSTFVMAAAGFLAGFLGPIIVDPGANQGPLLGIFITGPLGVVAGAVLGFVLPRVAPGRLRLAILLALAAMAFAGIVAGLVLLRGPEFVGRLYHAEATDSRPAADLLPSAIRKWEDSAKRHSYMPPPGWQDDRRKMVADANGSIVTLKNVSIWLVHRQRNPWNNGHYIFALQPSEERLDAFIVPDGSPASPEWFISKSAGVPADWPPRDVGNFLGVVEITRAPSGLRPPEE